MRCTEHINTHLGYPEKSAVAEHRIYYNNIFILAKVKSIWTAP
jgi:hypothetical protein